eukprot:6746222-Prymnesium_polylepis.1
MASRDLPIAAGLLVGSVPLLLCRSRGSRACYHRILQLRSEPHIPCRAASQPTWCGDLHAHRPVLPDAWDLRR